VLEDVCGSATSLVFEEAKRELASLMKRQPLFGRIDHALDLEAINFRKAAEVIRTYALNWYDLLFQLLTNVRSHRPSTGGPSSRMERRIQHGICTITSMVCHSQAQHNSNLLTALLTKYLMGSGTKRRGD